MCGGALDRLGLVRHRAVAEPHTDQGGKHPDSRMKYSAVRESTKPSISAISWDAIAFAAPIATLIFAAKEIPCVGTLFSKIEAVGLTNFYQKIAVAGDRRRRGRRCRRQHQLG